MGLVDDEGDGMAEHDHRDRGDDRPSPDTRLPGERPGLNGDPLGAAFRDGPRRRPQGVGAQLLTALPFVVLAVVVLVVATR